MDNFPEHISANLAVSKDYYSMDVIVNIERCKTDERFLGECLLANENLIWHSVHKYIGKPEVIVKNHCVEKDDILQLGRMGFIKAVKAFDTGRGVKFSSFAVTAIVREIRCFLRDSASIIRPTRTANELINKINRLEYEVGYLPSIPDIAIMLDEDEEKITKALQVGKGVKYLDEPVGTDVQQSQVITLLDVIDSGEGIEDGVIDKIYVDAVIESVKRKLSEKELNVLERRLQGFNQTQTADIEDVSQMRVSRIMRKVARLLESTQDKTEV
ncbi:sigma-70 family RNA polymerase sigma factor [Paenibacillus sp. D2_2]|uniref:sigma-70 family RNA polymerase sigma factor n=1 Tax=Paenibacillus sp. D2_2 TaxID=3073092 RepID=UPI0028165AA4|nr:sigma-70 family RNA polymerase sigma factor [Paenibacillus sp. D2_2]WMT39249.1 sigma-70 family RNA polymerase sigma factor [Paenibacillus sp. D2_2]